MMRLTRELGPGWPSFGLDGFCVVDVGRAEAVPLLGKLSVNGGEGGAASSGVLEMSGLARVSMPSSSGMRCS